MMRFRPLNDFLHAGEGVGGLVAQGEKLLTLHAAVASSLPQGLAGLTRVANLRGDTLVLHAAHNAVAAKLKHHAPAIVAGLAARGQVITHVRVEVHPDMAPAPPARRAPRCVSEAGARALGDLLGTLPEGRLRDAVAALADKSARPTRKR